MSDKLEEIKSRIQTERDFIQSKYNIRKIGIFGSFVRGEEKPESDILVDIEKPIDMFDFLELEEFLSELTSRKVDLVSTKALKPGIGSNILSEVVYL